MTQRIYTWFSDKEFFDQLPKRVSSAALVLVDAFDMVLIVKANYKEHWTFPGGIIDPGESPRQAALRETREEVGIAMMSDEVSFSMVLDRMSEYAQSYQFIFQARFPEVMREQIVLQESEIEAYAFVSREQIISKDRFYAGSVLQWAQGTVGYIEQKIDVTDLRSEV